MRAKLESEGIPAFVADEHTINMQWLYSNALGGVKLQVSQSDMSKAIEIIKQDFSSDVEEEVSWVCEECGSTGFSYMVNGKKMAYLMFLLAGFPLWPFTRGVVCNNCGEFSRR